MNFSQDLFGPSILLCCNPKKKNQYSYVFYSKKKNKNISARSEVETLTNQTKPPPSAARNSRHSQIEAFSESMNNEISVMKTEKEEEQVLNNNNLSPTSNKKRKRKLSKQRKKMKKKLATQQNDTSLNSNMISELTNSAQGE